MTRSLLIAAGLLAGAAKAVPAAEKPGDDPYLWLEDIHGSRAMEWVKGQNDRTLAVLTADPRYLRNYDAMLAIYDATDRIPLPRLVRDRIYNHWQDASHPKGVWRRTTVPDYAEKAPHWDLLLDVDQLAATEHENWVWQGASFDQTMTRCLVRLSPGGGDAAVVREFDLATKSFLPAGFNLPAAKSSIDYAGTDTVLVGTDFGPGSLTSSGYPRVIKLWRRGEPLSQARPIFEGQNSDVGVSPVVLSGPDGYVPFIQRYPTFFESEYYHVDPAGALSQLPVPLSARLMGMTQGRLLFTLREDWTPPGGSPIGKGSLIAFALQPFLATGRLPSVFVLYAPGPRASIGGVSAGRDAVYASIEENVIGSVHSFRPRTDGSWSDTRLTLPAGGSTEVISTNDYGPEAYFSFASYLTPNTLYSDDGGAHPQPIKALPARFDASGLVSEQFEATSADGTKIPYTVVRPRAAPGPYPTVLYGYGGFQISLTPSYATTAGKLWLEKGGAFVVANIRGGGEFGPGWHDAALKEHRQRAFDDFAAVARDLETRGIATPPSLAIMGGSNGGLLVSTVMTQHPELFGAVVCQVPLIDMLRYTHIGAGASWEAEYGDPAVPAERAFIEKYSPYQNVFADRHYPPVLFVTATSDDRVTPVHARKMAAKMEAQGHEVLFYENTDGGHAAAANHRQQAEMWALSYVYLARELGLKN